MSKITPRVREQAAIYCRDKANGFLILTLSSPAIKLAIKAVEHASLSIPDYRTFEGITKSWKAAEALLRTGWEP